MPRLLWQDEMISFMNVGQLWGHSCLRMDTRTRFSLLRRVRSVRRLSSSLESWRMKLTTKLRMPVAISSRQSGQSAGRTLALVPRQHLPPGHDDIVKDLESQICAVLAPRHALHLAPANSHFVWGYCASCRILSTSSQASGFSLNCGHVSMAGCGSQHSRAAYLVERSLSLFLLQRDIC
jgi:hypothetical protein